MCCAPVPQLQSTPSSQTPSFSYIHHRFVRASPPVPCASKSRPPKTSRASPIKRTARFPIEIIIVVTAPRRTVVTGTAGAVCQTLRRTALGDCQNSEPRCRSVTNSYEAATRRQWESAGCGAATTTDAALWLCRGEEPGLGGNVQGKASPHSCARRARVRALGPPLAAAAQCPRLSAVGQLMPILALQLARTSWRRGTDDAALP